MNRISESLYIGEVVHRRLSPIRHSLRYRVFSVLFDCDTLDTLDRRLRLFSYNRFNLVSLHDRDHGNGEQLSRYLRDIAARATGGEHVRRFVMLCYPRVLGYAFNPLTVYFGLDARDDTRLVIYEVNNTFGERCSYVLPVSPDSDGVVTQACRKRLHVSPFNSDRGTYLFHLTPPGDDLTVGVALKDEDGPLLKAYFRGRRGKLTDKALLAALARTGWMTVRVKAGIYYEAAKLRWKGLRPTARKKAPKVSVSFISEPHESS